MPCSAQCLLLAIILLNRRTESFLFQPTRTNTWVADQALVFSPQRHCRPWSRCTDLKRHGSNNHHGEDEDGSPYSATQIQQRLVNLGLEWNQTSITPDMTRVPGCVATVYVIAKVDDDQNVVIQGNSDAIVSRGLLFLLSEFVQARTATEVLELQPENIAEELGVRLALTKGRNDGLANMLRIMQQQLCDEEIVDTSTTLSCPSDNEGQPSSNKPTVALLLSGGVDSSVALRLLQEQGYDVTAFYLKIWLEDELAHLGECPWEDDVQICQQVCDQAGVPLEVISLQEQYHERVMQHTLNEAALGRTPNPDILCNSRVKFGCFLDYLGDDRFDFIASGHYARLIRDDNDTQTSNPVRLFRAPDPVKDQSLFLCALQQSQLQKLLFPIGHLEKSQVRQLAEEFQLPNRKRPDSQGLCFLGKIKFSDFLQIHLGESPGDIVDAFTGEIIGEHKGVWYHTVGQRKGIGKSLFPLATARGPWYVVAKDPAKRIVYASNQYDEDVFSKARSEFHVENIHWITGVPPNGEGTPFRLSMKIRHGPRLVQGTLELTSDSDEGIIKLDQKDGGLAPGQYAVFYTEDAECLGGGIISERHWAKFLLDTKSREKEEAIPNE